MIVRSLLSTYRSRSRILASTAICACLLLAGHAHSALTPPLLLSWYGDSTMLVAGNTPSTLEGTDFGEAHRAGPVTRTYNIRHMYPVNYNFPAQIGAIASNSPDFVIGADTCTGTTLTGSSPRCTFNVTFKPNAPWGSRAAQISYTWTQAGPTTITGTFNAGGVSIPQPCTFDIDGDGTVEALTDGLILMRAMFGMTGAAVTTGAVSKNATRPVWMAAQLPTVDNSIRLYLNTTCGRNFGP